MCHQVFNKSLSIYLDKAQRPTEEDIVAVMKDELEKEYKPDTTLKRRAQTVIAWIEWIIQLTNNP